MTDIPDFPSIPDVSAVPPSPRRWQTSISRLFVLTVLMAVFTTVAPRLYKRGYWGIGEILTVVLVGTVIAGGAIGLLRGGMEQMFEGVIVALFIFAAAAILFFVGVALAGF